MPEDRDKVTVGVTREGAENLAALMTTGWFADEVDAYRVSIAAALGAGLNVDAVVLAGVQTKYNVGTLDRDGQISELVRVLAASQPRPFEYCERLADAGLRYLRSRVVDQGMMLAEAIGKQGVTD